MVGKEQKLSGRAGPTVGGGGEGKKGVKGGDGRTTGGGDALIVEENRERISFIKKEH